MPGELDIRQLHSVLPQLFHRRSHFRDTGDHLVPHLVDAAAIERNPMPFNLLLARGHGRRDRIADADRREEL
jgi:hypothetical protein